MGTAFQCDDCGDMYARRPDKYVTISGQGILMETQLQLCHSCAVMRFDGLIEYDPDQVDEDIEVS